MSSFDYLAPAELFFGKACVSARASPMKYRRFATSAEAIKYAVESLEPWGLLSAAMIVGAVRYEGAEIRALYDGKNYPLTRIVD
jgi:hypothetical protein